MTEIEELRQEFAEFKAMLLTADQYLRYERLPQLVGGNVTHFAGSEEVAVVGDRWEYKDPQFGTPGSGYDAIDIVAGAASVTVLNTTETGKLMSIGVSCGGSDASTWSGFESVDADLRITIDGGTPTNLPLAGGSPPARWSASAIPWNTSGDPARGAPERWGVREGDAFSIDLNFEYKTSLKIELVVNSVANFVPGNNCFWFCYTHRAVLVSA